MATPFEIRFDGATLAGEADGFGLPVVFLHADVTDRRLWAGQMQAVAVEGYHVVSYDRRGFGWSSQPWGGYGFNIIDPDGYVVNITDKFPSMSKPKKVKAKPKARPKPTARTVANKKTSAARKKR